MSVVEEIRIIRDDLNQFHNTYENFNRYLDWSEYYQKFGFQNELESSDEDLSDWEDEYWMDTSEDDERLVATDNCKRRIREIKNEIKKKLKVGESCEKDKICGSKHFGPGGGMSLPEHELLGQKF